jgi:3-oxoacyl-[acyl-carrier protein] reductase
VLVTGGSRGIGQAIVKAFVENGDKVIFFHQRSGSGQATLELCRDLPGKLRACQVDVSSFDAVQEAIAEILSDYGHVDVLVNNAGITRDNLLLRLDEKAWDEVFDTNLKGAFAAIKAVYRAMMKARFGRIINISSVVGLIGNAGQANYAASKAGLIGLTKSVAKELATRNVTCNAVCPGFIQTDMTEELTLEQKAALSQNIPLKRLGTSEDVAAAVLFLASEAAAYITGQCLNVDGGMVT